jgi:hypothetical protein
MRLRDHIVFLLRRSGVYLNRARRSVWIHGDEPEHFEAARPLLKWLRTGVSAERLLLTSDRPGTCRWLRARYPNDNTLPAPFEFPPLLARFFQQLHPVVLILLCDRSRARPVWLRYAHRYEVPIVVIEAGADQSATIEIVARAIRISPNARAPLPDRTAPRRLDEFGRSALGRLLVANRSARRLDGLESLRDRLGRPETILCLGNGPSCEDPRLADLSYDAMFRVNWRWLPRGILTKPDMVFVGDLRTTARISSCVFGFRTIAWESEVLLRHLFLHLSLRRLEYFTYERVSPLLNDDLWPILPTNGIVMVATAVDLRPKKIIIAGMDLYQDPGGRYPGDIVAENDYPQIHSREVEVRALKTILGHFTGEISILGDPLSHALSNVEAVS